MVTTRRPSLEALDSIIRDIIVPAGREVDEQGAFPRQAFNALGDAGLLGLVSAAEVGGMGLGLREASLVIEKVGGACASTATVLAMHYAATAILEKYGSDEVRRSIADGRHVTTLAFSEAGSRSHFWAPVSTATDLGEQVLINAKKSFVTSAGQADSYVWTSKPMAAEGLSSLWYVPANTPGLSIKAPFDGLGLRGNHSSPVTADSVILPKSFLLGADGAGFDIMMSIVLPYFQLLCASCCVGMMEAATTKAAAHVASTRLEHAGQSLADLPTIRAYLARMRIKTDLIRALLRDTIVAIEEGREDTMLRILEVKAASADMSTEVTDLAMRVCGGAAYRKENGIERIFRDSRAATVMAPTTDVLYDFIGKAVVGMPVF